MRNATNTEYQIIIIFCLLITIKYFLHQNEYYDYVYQDVLGKI